MTSLTVIMPTYNGGKFLRPQIDSILSQSDPDFELLVIDDGSTDDTVSIVEDYARRDRRVRRLPSTSNTGQRLRLRQLVSAATTDFIAFADQDDVWDVNRNARLLAAIGDRAVAFGRSQLIDAEGTDLGRSILEALDIDPPRIGPLTGLFRPLVSAHAAVVRRDWLNIGVFFQTRPFDQVIGLEAMLSLGLKYVDDAVVRHRIHGGNQMNGEVVRSGPGRIFSRIRLRSSTSFLAADRLYFFQMLEALSLSEALSSTKRASFKRATDACRYAWYQLLDFRSGKGRRLELELKMYLAEFAAAPDDLLYFTNKVRLLTRPQFSPINLAEGSRRYIKDMVYEG